MHLLFFVVALFVPSVTPITPALVARIRSLQSQAQDSVVQFLSPSENILPEDFPTLQNPLDAMSNFLRFSDEVEVPEIGDTMAENLVVETMEDDEDAIVSDFMSTVMEDLPEDPEPILQEHAELSEIEKMVEDLVELNEEIQPREGSSITVVAENLPEDLPEDLPEVDEDEEVPVLLDLEEGLSPILSDITPTEMIDAAEDVSLDVVGEDDEVLSDMGLDADHAPLEDEEVMPEIEAPEFEGGPELEIASDEEIQAMDDAVDAVLDDSEVVIDRQDDFSGEDERPRQVRVTRGRRIPARQAVGLPLAPGTATSVINPPVLPQERQEEVAAEEPGFFGSLFGKFL